jgi:hypothetical protein
MNIEEPLECKDYALPRTFTGEDISIYLDTRNRF